MRIIKSFFLSGILFFSFYSDAYAQQQISVKVSPDVNVSINGLLDLDRSKYFNLASSVKEIHKINSDSRFDYYFKDLEMTVGRQLGLVFSETRWGNGFKEDAARPGYMDIDFFKSKANPNDNGLEAIKNIFGSNQGLANHDRHSAYPDFMETYTKEGKEDEKYPVNNEAAAEMVAHMLKYKYTDFQRPSYFELVNEPNWRFWGDQRFQDFHTVTRNKVKEMDIATEIGGPCYSVSYFYKDQFGSLSSLTNFIDNTNFELDFYSFHSYDYMKWDDAVGDFTGSITSGLPLESVFDALASYTFNKYGKELTYVGSEHGGYITDGDNRDFALDKLANQHFPGTGFEFEMKKRSIDNFIMVNSTIANTLTYMNHPHIVKKAVPFILLESAGWDPYYYSSLLVKEDFNKNSNNWSEAKLIHFFEYFADVKGRRIESFSADTDIQHHAFVDNKTLILLFHNQSNEPGNIDVEIDDINNPIQDMKIRRLTRGADFRATLSEESIDAINEVSISGQESIVLFVNYQNAIESTEEVNELIHYSPETANVFSGTKEFNITIPEHKKAKYAIVRVGISRSAGNGKEVGIKLNGKTLNVPIEDCADRITQSDYATTKIIKVHGSWLTEDNKVEVSFPDSKSGGVGAVAIRAALMDTEREDDDLVTGLEDEALEKRFKLFPNPTENQLKIATEKSGNVHVIDLSGKVILKKGIKAGYSILDLTKLARGNYILKFFNAQGVISKKIILQ